MYFKLYLFLYWIIINFIITKCIICPDKCNCNEIKTWRCELNDENDYIDCSNIKLYQDHITVHLKVSTKRNLFVKYFKSTNYCKITFLILKSATLPTNSAINNLIFLQRLILLNSMSSTGASIDLIHFYDFLKDINSIETIKINNHEITSFSTRLFYYCSNINLLELKSLKLKRIDNRAFINCNKLENLNIRYNSLNILNPSAFYGLTKLNSLRLSDNSIREIENINWYNLNNLQMLDLSRNNILELSYRSFYGLNNLTKLYLNENQIRKISTGTFEGLDNLQELYLNKNKLKTFDLYFLRPMKRTLIIIKLEMSLLICIDHKNSLYTFKDSIIVIFSKFQSCDSLKKEDGKKDYSISTTTEPSMQVLSSEIKNVIITVSVLLIIFIIIIFIISYFCFTKKLRKYRGAPCYSHSSCPHSTNNDLPLNYMLNSDNQSTQNHNCHDMGTSATFCNFYPTAHPMNGISRSNTPIPLRYQSVPVNINRNE